VRPKLESGLGPSIEVRLSVDLSTGPLGVPHTPVLLERPGAFDGGRVGARADADGVAAAVGGDGALGRAARGGVEGAEVLNNVVLDERVLSPTVHS